MIGVIVKTACSVQVNTRDFPSNTALYFLSNDIEGHKKESLYPSDWFH